MIKRIGQSAGFVSTCVNWYQETGYRRQEKRRAIGLAGPSYRPGRWALSGDRPKRRCAPHSTWRSPVTGVGPGCDGWPCVISCDLENDRMSVHPHHAHPLILHIMVQTAAPRLLNSELTGVSSFRLPPSSFQYLLSSFASRFRRRAPDRRTLLVGARYKTVCHAGIFAGDFRTLRNAAASGAGRRPHPTEIEESGYPPDCWLLKADHSPC